MSYFDNCMNDIKIDNEELMEILDEVAEFAKSEVVRSMEMDNEKERSEDYVSNDYLDYIVQQGHAHVGYPESAKSKSLQVGHFNLGEKEDDLFVTKKVSELNKKLQSFLGVRNNALFMIYPPGGYIAWHNNQNASAYNIILTWSEEGNGYWKHVDPVTKEVVTIPDVKGWQCKSGYYGSYEDGMDKVVYHCAATECWRITVAFMYDRTSSGREMAEMVLDDISNNYK